VQLTEVVVQPEARCGSGATSLSSELDDNGGWEREERRMTLRGEGALTGGSHPQ
jgi:hypothetical protein